MNLYNIIFHYIDLYGEFIDNFLAVSLICRVSKKSSHNIYVFFHIQVRFDVLFLNRTKCFLPKYIVVKPINK